MNVARTIVVFTLLFLAPADLCAQTPSTDEAPALSASDLRLQRRAIRVLQKAREGSARIAAAKALADLGDKASRDVLEAEVTEHPNDPYAYAALVWLGVDPYVQNARTAVADPATGISTVTIYGAAFTRRPNPEVRTRLLGAWKDASLEPMERLWAACILLEMGDRSVRKYVEAFLADADSYVAAVAASALLAVGHTDARRKLLDILRDRKTELRDIAAMALGEHPDREALPALGKALKHARDPHDKVWVSWAVLKTLGYRFHGAP